MFVIERSPESGIEYVYTEGKKPYGWFVESDNGQWWASIPSGDIHGYYPTRQAALAAITWYCVTKNGKIKEAE